MTKKKGEAKDAIKQKIKIKLKAYDHKVLDSSCRQIVETVVRFGVEIIGPVPLPTEIQKFTVNRSTFVHKDSREQFEVRTHKRLLEVINPTPRVIDGLMNLNLPAGVNIEIKM
ncbi:MAG: 30S ribosomal protein S10 [Candidatus Pacebacteria bacterium]|nr:30S ribosomal protein S10 [Candidatus Paceibacterota bacterium]